MGINLKSYFKFLNFDKLKDRKVKKEKLRLTSSMRPFAGEQKQLII